MTDILFQIFLWILLATIVVGIGSSIVNGVWALCLALKQWRRDD